jgi:hypothetical protein
MIMMVVVVTTMAVGMPVMMIVRVVMIVRMLMIMTVIMVRMTVIMRQLGLRSGPQIDDGSLCPIGTAASFAHDILLLLTISQQQLSPLPQPRPAHIP